MLGDLQLYCPGTRKYSSQTMVFDMLLSLMIL